MVKSFNIGIIALFFFSFWGMDSRAQSNYFGIVLNENQKPALNVHIKNSKSELLAISDSAGRFELSLDEEPFLIFGYLNNEKICGKYVRKTRIPDKAVKTSLRLLDILDTLNFGQGVGIIATVEIKSRDQVGFMEEIKPRELALNTGVGSGIENIIKTLGGVSSNNELSSQYNVRGGNFDENLIYVNDIEIYRPQLIQNGQQEGLSFINPHLVEQLKFSAGGFESRYGDKMSSVLDVSYIRPDSFKSQISLGTMINAFTVEGKHRNFSGVLSIRHFSNSLLTATLNTKGTYSMNFADVQTLLKWKYNSFWSLEFLGNYAQNQFTLIPESRTTEFGTIVQAAYQLNVFMAGKESLNYAYQLGALTLEYKPNVKTSFKWIASATSVQEEENFDIEGAYSLSELDRDLGSSNLGKPLRTLGFGYYLDHGRNRMQSRILQFSHIGTIGKNDSKKQFKYGLRVNQETIYDRFYEWLYMDSADYNIAPWSYSQDSIVLDQVIRATNFLESFKYSGFAQYRTEIDKKGNWWINIGLRGNYWGLNQELLVMPRFALFWEPYKYFNKHVNSSQEYKSPVTYRLSLGAYHQVPFYRELRNFEGQLNQQLLAQKSWHSVLGMDRMVTLWGKKFKYSSEAYYKYMYDLVPYLYDNIRIRYYAQNSSNGYAWGMDNRLYGQFNKGLESWFTLSILNSKERIQYTNANGELTTSDWLRRPTDRRVTFAAIFQDRLPQNPTVRVNLSMMIGTGIPYFLDGKARYSTTPNIIPRYQRVDIGFSKVFRTLQSQPKKFKYVKESWVTLDVFNLLDINNVIAYSWVKDLNNNRYGVPEYLTGRRLNLRWYMSF